MKTPIDRSYLWLESISVEQGKLPLLEYHQERMKRTVADHHPGAIAPELREIPIPAFARNGWYKCRVLYDYDIRSISWSPYLIKETSRLKIKEVPKLEYHYKWADRKALNRMTETLGEREDVLITQNGILKDMSYANILCFDGEVYWTPEQPLLKGTRRAYLLDRGMIRTAQLSIDDLDRFQFIQPINAMLCIDQAPRIHINQISR